MMGKYRAFLANLAEAEGGLIHPVLDDHLPQAVSV
jgi:hypothetical protein